jgi:transposase
MPRFKPYDYRQDLMVPIKLEAQLPEGSLEYALHHLIEERVPDAWFEELYANEEIGRPAYSPKLLLKVILLGYARGIIGSRRLERACQENITFLALACGMRPDHSTLAAFVGKLQGRIELIFSEVLLVCHEEGLLSGTHLSLDGVKLPGNASRESSGTFAQLRWKADKLRRKVKEQLAEHRRQDRLDRQRGDRSVPERAQEKTRRATTKQKLLAQAERLERFVTEEEPRAIAQMTPLSHDPALVEPAKVQVTMLARQLLQLSAALKEYDSRIEQLFARQAEAFIWQSFPGAGPTLAPRLCCAFGSERSRYQSAAAIQQYSGIAPVTERSGKNQHWVPSPLGPASLPPSDLLRLRQSVRPALRLGQTLPPGADRQR